LVSQIGRPVADPRITDIRLRTKGRPVSGLGKEIKQVVDHHLARIGTLWEQLVGGDLRVY
jgi:S-adenosylmethionine synthetase